MSPDDIPAVAALEQRVFADPWSENAFREELATASRRYLVAEEGRAILGYGGLLVVEDDAHIVTLAVEPGTRGQGLGTRLMLRLAEEALRAGAAHLTLEVRVSNQPAQSLYRRFGFETVGLRRHYYRDEDALIMWALDIDSEGYRRRLTEIREGLR
ncbi:MAG: ribosomal-protein-alanine N-acetyltransferase [Actinobacteria bacterium RBG_16_70_17]|nr:MAG: ribosomal-protein-alanine N-acetyltransferase [Actinobacteria bacterium RBG_16_70_17]